jgi:hypothetical protein
MSNKRIIQWSGRWLVQRFDTAAELMVLRQLYKTLRLYTNFFQPPMKLKIRQRCRSRVKKSYYALQTPYQRVLGCREVTAADKKEVAASILTAQSRGPEARAR